MRVHLVFSVAGRLTALSFLSAAGLFASIDGITLNRTTGKPQAAVKITLLKPGAQGMQNLGSTVSDAAGHFVFEHDQPGGGPQLLQASYKSVNYNKLMTPNIPTSNVELDIYEPTKSPAVARITQQILFIEPNKSRVAVSEAVLVKNETNTTYYNPALGGLRFYLPPAANGQVRISAQSGSQGMPLPRAAERTETSDVYLVDFPIKPGETQFEVNYVLPAGSPFLFRGRIVNVKGMPAGPLRLIAPLGVTLGGKDVQNLGAEPKTHATVYAVTAPDAYNVDVTGVGTLHTPDETTGPSGEGDAPPVVEGQPQVYRHLLWLLSLAFSVLAAGMIFLFRNSPVRSPYGK